MWRIVVLVSHLMLPAQFNVLQLRGIFSTQDACDAALPNIMRSLKAQMTQDGLKVQTAKCIWAVKGRDA